MKKNPKALSWLKEQLLVLADKRVWRLS